MSDVLTVRPTRDPSTFVDADGTRHTLPAGWELVPPGDPALTRRIKAIGGVWVVEEKVRNKMFSRGLCAPAARVARLRAELDAERARPEYAKKLAAGAARREREQAEYVDDFEGSVREFLRFEGRFNAIERRLAALVTAHATPVGSGTVARTERIPVEDRARAAVIAWMRHQTTRYDNMHIERVKGRRREVRRELAKDSVALLNRHRGRGEHEDDCELCESVAEAEAANAVGPVEPITGKPITPSPASAAVPAVKPMPAVRPMPAVKPMPAVSPMPAVKPAQAAAPTPPAKPTPVAPATRPAPTPAAPRRPPISTTPAAPSPLGPAARRGAWAKPG